MSSFVTDLVDIISHGDQSEARTQGSRDPQLTNQGAGCGNKAAMMSRELSAAINCRTGDSLSTSHRHPAAKHLDLDGPFCPAQFKL